MSGDYGGPMCQRCDFQREGRCEKHELVVPSWENYVFCRDWEFAGERTQKKDLFRSGYLYCTGEGYVPDECIGAFSEFSEYRIRCAVSVVDNPEHGWTIYVPGDSWAKECVGSTITLMLGDRSIECPVNEIDMVMTYGYQDQSTRVWEYSDTIEKKLAILFQGNSQTTIRRFLEETLDLSKVIAEHRRQLADPHYVNKNKPTRIFAGLYGIPRFGEFALSMVTFINELHGFLRAKRKA